jgi:hypothetical protein
MFAPGTITDAQIRNAGDQIVGAGRRVTGSRGDPRRMLTVWQQTQPQRDMAPSDQPHTVAPPPLPPDLATHGAALRDRPGAEFDTVMATAWAVAITVRRSGWAVKSKRPAPLPGLPNRRRPKLMKLWRQPTPPGIARSGRW